MIAATIPISTMQMMIVQILLTSHCSIFSAPFGQFCGFPVGLYEHEQHACNQQDRNDQTDDIQIARKRAADLIDAESDRIRKGALIGDRERRPFGGVHFAFDSAHRRKAGSAEQVEHEERKARHAGEYLR